MENYLPFTDCISEIHNTQVDNAKGTDVVIPFSQNNYLEMDSRNNEGKYIYLKLNEQNFWVHDFSFKKWYWLIRLYIE